MKHPATRTGYIDNNPFNPEIWHMEIIITKSWEIEKAVMSQFGYLE